MFGGLDDQDFNQKKKISLVTSTPSKTVCKIFLVFHEASVLYVGDSLYFQ